MLNHQAIESLLSKPAVAYRTVRLIFLGQVSVGKTAIIRCIRYGLCEMNDCDGSLHVVNIYTLHIEQRASKTQRVHVVRRRAL